VNRRHHREICLIFLSDFNRQEMAFLVWARRGAEISVKRSAKLALQPCGLSIWV
jgi:hypothetical protein